MGDKPIIFSAPMVRALLDRRKSQTRRVLKPQPTLPWGSASHAGQSWWTHDSLTGDVIETWRLPYAVGDRLYVNEGSTRQGADVWSTALFLLNLCSLFRPRTQVQAGSTNQSALC